MENGSRPALGVTERANGQDEPHRSFSRAERTESHRLPRQRAHASVPTRLPKPVIIAVVVLAVFTVLWWWFVGRGGAVVPAFVDTSKYQTVELTNNRAYYGKIIRMNDTEIVLTDVFYIRAPSDAAADKNAQLELIKLGNEMAGATDPILLNRAQVTLVENLKETSTVVLKIKEYHTQNKQ